MACFIDNRYSLVVIDADIEDAGQYGCHCGTLSSTALAEMIMLGNRIAGTTLFHHYILRIFFFFFGWGRGEQQNGTSTGQSLKTVGTSAWQKKKKKWRCVLV